MKRVEPVAQFRDDVRDEVHDVAVAVDFEQLARAARVRLRDARQVVPREIDEHQVLGEFLGVHAQFEFDARIEIEIDAPVFAQPAPPRSRDGVELDEPRRLREFHGKFRRSAEHGEVPVVDVKHVGARIAALQHAVGGFRVRAGRAEAPRGNDLKNVAFADERFQVFDFGAVSLVALVQRNGKHFPRLRLRGGRGGGNEIFAGAGDFFFTRGDFSGNFRRLAQQKRENFRRARDVIDFHDGFREVEQKVRAGVRAFGNGRKLFENFDEIVGENAAEQEAFRGARRRAALPQRAQHVERRRRAQAAFLVEVVVRRRERERKRVLFFLRGDAAERLPQRRKRRRAIFVERLDENAPPAAGNAQTGVGDDEALRSRVRREVCRFEQQRVRAPRAADFFVKVERLADVPDRAFFELSLRVHGGFFVGKFFFFFFRKTKRPQRKNLRSKGSFSGFRFLRNFRAAVFSARRAVVRCCRRDATKKRCCSERDS